MITMIIRTIITSNGATVRIHDDFMAAPGSEEERRVIEAQRRAAYNILRKEAEQRESCVGSDER